MDDVEQFSKALNAIAQAGAYSAKDIRQICAQEVQCCEKPILWVDNIPYAAIRTPAVQVTVYERSMVSSNIQKKTAGLRANSIVGHIAWSLS